MNTNTTPQQIEKINYLAAGLLTAAGAHMILSLLGIPGLLASSTPGFLGILLTALKVSWSAAGFLAGAYVAYNAFFMVNARDFQKARVAAIGALVLPLLGMTGIITAFALIPVGALTLVVLRQPEWKAAFGYQVEGEIEVEAVPTDS